MSSSTSSLSKRELDIDDNALKSLLDAFGSIFSLRDIASAFYEAGHSAELAGEILHRKHQNYDMGEVYTDQEELSEISSQSSNSSGNFEPFSKNVDANFRSSKRNSNPVSVGSSSDYYQKKYTTKSEMRWVVKSSTKPDLEVNEHEESENFLCKMLQHGFRVNRDLIRQVLEECRYDTKKSLEKLLDLAAKSYYFKNELNKGNIPERNQAVGAERTSLASINVVFEESESKRVILPQDDNEEQDNEYYSLREAVKEYRSTMNEYYKAAAEAFAKGNHAQSSSLLKKGQFFYRKAREADEESAKKIFSSSMDEEETIPLNMENCKPKEAIRLVKSHLRNFSGIASVKYLRITNGIDEEDASRPSRLRLVTKLLERESISWTEDEDSGTILVSLDEIDHKRLSFAENN